MTQKNPLEKLLGSAPRVRILRLFLSNPDRSFSVEDVARQTKTDKKSVRRHLKTLTNIELITTKKNANKEEAKK